MSAPPLGPGVPAQRYVCEEDYTLVAALTNVRAAEHFVRELFPFIDGVVTREDLTVIARRLAKINARLLFKMGTIDAEALAFIEEQ